MGTRDLDSGLDSGPHVCAVGGGGSVLKQGLMQSRLASKLI